MRRCLALAGLGLAACAAAAPPLQAQGSGVDQQSACMSGRIGAGVASPCDDGSAAYFSPAALAGQGSVFSLGVHLVRTGNTFNYDQGVGPLPPSVEREGNALLPQLYLNVRPSPRLALAFGSFAPFGLGLEWPVCSTADPGCEGDNFEGRYTGYDNQLRSVYLQPTAAFQLIPGRLLVGAGADLVLATLGVRQRADAPQLGLSGVDVADAELEGGGIGFTGHVGAQLVLHPRLSVGARYLHSTEVEMDGDATFEQVQVGIPAVDAQIGLQFGPGGSLDDTNIETTIEFPSQLVVGVSARPLDRLELLFDWQRTGWSSFDQLDVDFENPATPDRTIDLGYSDTNTYRFGAEFAATDALALRAGFRYNEAATPRATPLLPENERNVYTLGLGYRHNRRLSADLAFQHVVQPDRRGAVRPGGPDVGVYESTGSVFGITLAYRFGRVY
ncbi:MAG TPA: outer membrane protein transport protein [Longimicrobiaceae bacterium]|nr:outer membrane protein transport protein [Longimicrobiaceae bacterium]